MQHSAADLARRLASEAEEESRLIEDVAKAIEPPVQGDKVEEIAMLGAGGVGLMFNST